MSSFARKLVFSSFAACLALTLSASPALAATHHKHHARTHHAAHAAKGSSITRIAQRHLSNLGYYTGKIDGVMGAQTRAAIRKFQHEQGLKADGVLGSRTTRALASADAHGASSGGRFQTHEAVIGADLSGAGPTNPDYAPGLGGGSATITSRFAQIDVAESGGGANKRYNINVNGEPLLIADGQPTVIGMSPAYNLGDEDAIIFTTYSPNAQGCLYRNHVLALASAGGKLLDIDSCTRDYSAVVKNGSLFITFSDHDSASVLGSTWRLEGMSLNKL